MVWDRLGEPGGTQGYALKEEQKFGVVHRLLLGRVWEHALRGTWA